MTTTTIARAAAWQLLAKAAWRSRQTRILATSRQIRGPSLLQPLSLLDAPPSICRYFATTNKRNNKKSKNNKKRKKAAAVVEESDSDDSDWEDDQVIPFGQPMVSRKDRKKEKKEKEDEDEDEDAQATRAGTSQISALQSVIDSGLNDLKATSTMISNQNETKKPLFHKAAIGEDTGPTKQQLAEAHRVLTVAQNCLEEFEMKGKEHPLTIGGESILLVHVEVNANLREATVYWALPLEIMLDAPQRQRMELVQFMQHKLEKGGAGGFLQYQVHRVLRSYYPPKLKFKPASDAILQHMIHDFD